MTFFACCRADFLQEEGRSSSTGSTPRKSSKRRNKRRFINRRLHSIKANNFTDHSKMMSIATVVKTLSLRSTATKGSYNHILDLQTLFRWESEPFYVRVMTYCWVMYYIAKMIWVLCDDSSIMIKFLKNDGY